MVLLFFKISMSFKNSISIKLTVIYTLHFILPKRFFCLNCFFPVFQRKWYVYAWGGSFIQSTFVSQNFSFNNFLIIY